jgi:hypothetical protein
MIAAQPLPALAEGALIRKSQGGTTAIIGEGDQDEAVLPMKTGIKEIVNGIINGLTGAVLPPAKQPALALPGVAPGPANATLQRPLNIYAGVIVADDGGMKALERRLQGFRISENQRKGID